MKLANRRWQETKISLHKYLKMVIIINIAGTIAATIFGLILISYNDEPFLIAAGVLVLLQIIVQIVITAMYKIDSHNAITHIAAILLLTVNVAYVPFFASHLFSMPEIKTVHEINIDDKLKYYSIQDAELIFDKERIGTESDTHTFTKTVSSRTGRRTTRERVQVSQFTGVAVVPFKSTIDDEKQYWCAFFDYGETENTESGMSRAKKLRENQYERAMNINTNGIDIQSFTKLSPGKLGYNLSTKAIKSVNNDDINSDNIVILLPDEKGVNLPQFWTPFFILALIIQIIGLKRMFVVKNKYKTV